MDCDEKLLRQASANVEMLDSGCCGMAGSFGYEHDKYLVSLTIAGQKLLPAINNAAQEDVIVASGFSCRTQIAALSRRKAVTLPEILAGRIKERNPI
jgi:Fe-S oxidoreductase